MFGNHRPGIPMPPSMPPTVDCIWASTLRAASLTAARTRSCSISTSPDFTASGSIRRLSNCLRPSIFAVTVPPPDVASTTVYCILFCRASYCDLAFDIRSCKLNPPMDCCLSFLRSWCWVLDVRKFLLPKTQYSLPFVPVINDGADLRSELFLHATDDWILLRAA